MEVDRGRGRNYVGCGCGNINGWYSDVNSDKYNILVSSINQSGYIGHSGIAFNQINSYRYKKKRFRWYGYNRRNVQIRALLRIRRRGILMRNKLFMDYNVKIINNRIF